jgi:lysozyme
LVSFSFNVGLGNLQNSTLRMKVNRKEFAAAAEEFLKWTKAGGKVLKGLVTRRNDERALFIS